MLYDEINERHIYNVNFEPVRNAEFRGSHFALVLKKNPDDRSVVVMPLTSSKKGLGISKVLVEKINTLPSNLRENDTYAVFNQVRTIDVSRISKLRELSVNPPTYVEAEISEKDFKYLVELALEHIGDKLTKEEKLEYHFKKGIAIRTDLILECAYRIKKLDTQNKTIDDEVKKNENEKEIERLKNKLSGIIKITDTTINFSDNEKEYGVDSIIEKIITIEKNKKEYGVDNIIEKIMTIEKNKKIL